MVSIASVLKLCTSRTTQGLLKNVTRNIGAAMYVKNVRLMSTFIPDHFQHLHTLQTWGHDVHPYGKLIVSVPFNVKVVPLDEEECPFMDKAFITLYGDKEKHHMLMDVMEFNRFYTCSIDMRDHEREIDFIGTITEEGHQYFAAHGGSVPLDCLIQVPIKFGLSLHMMEDGNVDVESMESHDIQITTQSGDSVLRCIKSGSVHVNSWSGNISCWDSIQANIELKTSLDGNIKAEKLQGEHVKVRTENGDIKTKDIYAHDANFWSQTGEIRLGGSHGNIVTDVHHGNIFIDTVDGNLQASIGKGYFEGHISRIDNKVTVKNGEGNIRLQVPDTLDADLDLSANHIVMSNDVVVYDAEEHNTADDRRRYTGKLNGGSKHPVVASTNKGSVCVESVNWFDTLKLEK